MTRNEILEIVKQFYESNVTEREIAFARFVMAIEREACAQLVQANADVCGDDSILRGILKSNAAAIRARGNKT